MQGKLGTKDLIDGVFKHTGARRKEVLIRPSVGEDCAAINTEEAVVISMDPITATASELGKLSIRVNVNDVSAQGAEPYAIMLCLLMPTESTPSDVEMIMKSASEECKALNIEIAGGHTEFTSAVNQPVCCGVCFAKKSVSNLMKMEDIKSGMSIILAGSAGIEGSGIIAIDREDQLKTVLEKSIIESAKAMIEDTSVVEIGKIGTQLGIVKMHDVTEGGVFGAIWEMCEGADLGCRVDVPSIPVREETRLICSHFGISEYRLIGSGAMLMVAEREREEDLILALKEAGFTSAVIGEFTPSISGRTLIYEGGRAEDLSEPCGDALYDI